MAQVNIELSHDCNFFQLNIHKKCDELFDTKNDNIDITHVNLNDDTVEGISFNHKNCFSVQYHPESSPGPHDSRYLFDQFITRINESKKNE